MAGQDDVRVWKKILIDGIPYEVLKSEHLKGARGKGMEKTILLNLKTGATMSKTFREVDKVEGADIAMVSAEFLYSDPGNYYFMNLETYDQVVLDKKILGDKKSYLVDGDKVVLMQFEWQPLSVQLETSVAIEVESTPPGEKWDTATGGKKPAELITGLTVQVPLFIKNGDKIRVDTRTGQYLSRV